MPQSILIQVGQCGNQIGSRFWDMALHEHAQHAPSGRYTDAMATFFRNVDAKYHVRLSPPILYIMNGSIIGRDAPVGSMMTQLRARGIMVDMEEGVVNAIRKTPLSELFDADQHVTSVSGCGNNWSVGHHHYGPLYRDHLHDSIRKQAEHCDALQSFFLCHSMGGGTGSGLGTYLLEQLSDEYPDVYRFATVVFPSADDDVVTSPYNSVLALSKLTEHADCVLPIENQALLDIHDRIGAGKNVKKGTAIVESDSALSKKRKPFDSMNNIISNVMLNMTSSMRFEGSLNVDINEISMNLVPFPKLKYLISSLTPLYVSMDVQNTYRKLDQMFSEAFSRDNQLIKADPRSSAYIACALMVRGNVELSDIRRNIDRMKKQLRFVHWNQDGWKTGLCSVPPVKQSYSLLTLSNNCCIRHTFSDLRGRFMKLYKRKAHVYHYTDHMDPSYFDTSLQSIDDLIAEYTAMESAVPEETKYTEAALNEYLTNLKKKYSWSYKHL